MADHPKNAILEYSNSLSMQKELFQNINIVKEILRPFPSKELHHCLASLCRMHPHVKVLFLAGTSIDLICILSIGVKLASERYR